MMSDPDTGMASMDWQYGGMFPEAPPVLVVRNDSIPFTIDDWYALDDFEMEMLDNGPCEVFRENFIALAKSRLQEVEDNTGLQQQGLSLRSAPLLLEAVFPKGITVRACGLKQEELNGKQGTVIGRYENGRVGVKFSGRADDLAVKPGNLERLRPLWSSESRLR